MIFDHPKGKAKRDEDTGEGASNCPNKKKNKKWREARSWPLPTSGGVGSPPRVPRTTSRSCLKGHA